MTTIPFWRLQILDSQGNLVYILLPLISATLCFIYLKQRLSFLFLCGQISAPSRPCWNFVWFATLHGSGDNATPKVRCKGEIFSSQVIANLHKMISVNFKLNMQADLWSVGAILFQLVTGKTPFTGNNQIQVWLQNISPFHVSLANMKRLMWA